MDFKIDKAITNPLSSYQMIIIVLWLLSFVTLASLCWMSWATWETFRDTSKLSEKLILVERMRGDIIRYNEARSNAIRLAILTGNKKYHLRYARIEPLLDKAIKDSSKFSPNIQSSLAFATIDTTNRSLVKQEREIFQYLNSKKKSKAIKIFKGKAYNKDKKMYVTSLRLIEGTLISLKGEMLDGKGKDVARSIYYNLIIVASLIVIWSMLLLYKNFHDKSRLQNSMKKAVRSEMRYRQLAHYDILTDLPNRLFFTQKLNEAVMRNKSGENSSALVFLDLDYFKKVNDSFGHSIGDKLIVYAANRLRHCIRQNDVLSRLGGDEFCIILESVNTSKAVEAYADRILESFRRPFNIGDREIYSTISMGVAFFSPNKSAEDVLQNADMALYRAKAAGRNCYVFYAQQFSKENIRLLEVESNLRHAIKRNEVNLVYQPQFDINTNKVIGLEALLRWNSKTLDDVFPDEFIPIAEETGLIYEIDDWVIDHAFDKYSMLKKQFGEKLDSMVMSINVSALKLTSRTISSILAQMTKEYNVNPGNIVIEITETALIQSPIVTLQNLNEMCALGLRVAIDDFGTGYSSLTFVKDSPVNILKIDKTFVQDLITNDKTTKLVESILQIGKHLQLEIVAEGVETKEQYDWLIENGCSKIQGFYLSHPISSDELDAFLTKHL